MKIFLTLFFLISLLNLKAQVTVSGIAKNYKDSVFYILEIGGFHNITQSWRDKRVRVVIDNNNHFKITIPEDGIGSWFIRTNSGTQFFELIKDKNLELIADFSLKYPLRAIGTNAADFNYSMYARDSMAQDILERFHQGIKSENIDSVLLCRKEYAAFQRKVLNGYNKTYQMSATYYNWLNSKYRYEPFERTLVENIRNKDLIDNSTLSKLLENGINDDYAALNTAEYNYLIGIYIRVKLKENNKGNSSIAESFNCVADTNILTGNTKDVYLSRFMAGLIKIPDSVYKPLFNRYDQIVQNKQLKQYIINQREDYIQPTISNAQVISPGSSINEIFKKYKGKIIYLDFWASWCVPCRTEMPNVAKLKNKLKGKDIIFIYFGYNDKEKAWSKARNQLEIEGEHYLLNDKLIKEADEIFGINGIPHYAIIDKEGRIVSKRADGPTDVYEQLLKIVEK